MSIVYCNDIMHEVDTAFWEEAIGRKLQDGEDITGILSMPHDIWGGEVKDYALCKGYEGKYTASIITTRGSGGGNPYVKFVWRDQDSLEEWYINRVGIPMGLNVKGAREELAWHLARSNS